MEKQYDLGDTFDELKINVDIGTPGLASTGVYLVMGGGQFRKLAESDVDSGDVLFTEEDAQNLVGHLLKVRTIVDFVNVDEDQWETLSNAIVSTLTLSGGFSGIQTYLYDADDKTTSGNFRWCIIDHQIRIK